MKCRSSRSKGNLTIGLVLLALTGSPCFSSGAANTEPLDLLPLWHSEVSQGHYVSYELVLKATSTKQLSNMLSHGVGKVGPEESLDLLVTQHLATVSVDPATQFRNIAQPGAISAPDNPLNAPVALQTVTVTDKSIDLLISNSLSAFVAKTDRVRVHTVLPRYLMPDDVALQGMNVNLRGALNQIGKAIACGWAVRSEYTTEMGYYLTAEFVSLPRRKEIPWVQPTPGKSLTNDPVALLAIARTGNPNERRLAEVALMGYVSDERFLKQIQDLALEFLRSPDIQQRHQVVGSLPFIFKFPYDEPALSVGKRFPERAKDISRIRESTDLKYQDLMQLLKTGDSLEKGLACERFGDAILSSSQFTPGQINEVWKILVSLLEDKEVFVRWESGEALKLIAGLTTSNQQVQ